MSLQVEKLENNTAKLTIEVPAEEVEKAIESAYQKSKSKFSIPGFRKGKVPRKMIEKMYGVGVFYEDAVNSMIPGAYADAATESELEIVAQPEIDIVQIEAGKPFIFTAEVVLKPEVELGKYKGIEVEAKDTTVTDEEVDAELAKVQEQNSRLVAADDKEVENGDQVTIDFVGEKDGVAFEGGSGENYPLELGSGTFIPGFEEQLVGVKTGDQKDVVVTFPEDYQAKDLAGQEATFKVTVHDIKYKELPEANDELVQKLKMDGVETLEQFKEKKADDLKAQKEKSAEDAFVNALIEKVCENATVEIPEVMIESQIDREYKNFENRMMQSGFTAKQYLEAVGQTEAQLRETMRPSAEQNVKASLVLDAIVKAENIVIDDEAVENEFKQMSETYGMDVEKIKGIINPENVKYDLAQQKALELIKESVK